MLYNPAKYTITLVGSGNLAWHLGHTVVNLEINVDKVISHTLNSARALGNELGCGYSDSLNDINGESDFIIVAVDDSHLREVLIELKNATSVVLHTSGSIGIDVFHGICSRYGVFYPFQTFTKGIPVDITEVPICIEASEANTLTAIYEFASTISRHVEEVNSEQRRWLHLSGVVANNFTNHLAALASDLLEKHALNKALLFPLLKGTVDKLMKTSAYEAQTGPARRMDHTIIERHLGMLNEELELKNLYSMLSDSIIAYYS